MAQQRIIPDMKELWPKLKKWYIDTCIMQALGILEKEGLFTGEYLTETGYDKVKQLVENSTLKHIAKRTIKLVGDSISISIPGL